MTPKTPQTKPHAEEGSERGVALIVSRPRATPVLQNRSYLNIIPINWEFMPPSLVSQLIMTNKFYGLCETSANNWSIDMPEWRLPQTLRRQFESKTGK